jgi:hypothetical protein
MIPQRNSLQPVAFLAIALWLGGCATGRLSLPGEPSPKDDPIPESAAADPSPRADVADADKPAESTAEAPKGDAVKPPAQAVAPSAPATPAAPSQMTLASKPHIIAKVESVQFPAWIERGGIRAGIKAGWAIYTGDEIITGGEGRVLLGTVGEGRLQISGDADVRITEAYDVTSGPEPSLLTLRRGSIAFSAPMMRAGVPGTLINIRDGISANVLGGQIFAKADNEEDLMTLVDGVVEVSGPKLNPGSMKAPGTFIRVPRVGRAQPVSETTQDRIARWISGTEFVNGRPMLEAAGTWDVSLNSGYNLKQLESIACRIQNRGYPSEIYPVREPGKQVWYRVVVRRFKSKNDAVDFLGTARALGSREPWVLLPQT